MTETHIIIIIIIYEIEHSLFKTMRVLFTNPNNGHDNLIRITHFNNQNNSRSLVKILSLLRITHFNNKNKNYTFQFHLTMPHKNTLYSLMVEDKLATKFCLC